MPLASKNNGCYECYRRRIECDKREPVCLKCQKKGIACSGQGIRIRFSTGKGRAKVGASSRTLQATAKATIVPEEAPRTSNSFAVSRLPSSAVTDSSSEHGSSSEAVTAGPESHGLLRVRRAAAPRYAVPIGHSLESVNVNMRILLHHFSACVAPNMVVYDRVSNGYRDIILPLACEDTLVGQAVSVVAAFHLAAKVPHLQAVAEAGQLAIISKLRRDSLRAQQPEQLFSLSAWATILVLLVGETVTGGNDYVYLTEMLMCMTMSANRTPMGSRSLEDFILKQTKMFALFGFAMSHEAKGVQTVRNSLEPYLEFLSYPLSSESQHYKNVSSIRDAFRYACELYCRRIESGLPTGGSQDLLECIQHKVLSIDHTTEGAHALVWPYFVAAAESRSAEQREFFTSRLRALYGVTQFRSIPQAMKALPMIWERQEHQRWTEIMTSEAMVLVI